MGGRIMVNVVQGMGGSLAGNHPAHDQKTGQNSENEPCAGWMSHDGSHLGFSIGKIRPSVKRAGRASSCPLSVVFSRIKGRI